MTVAEAIANLRNDLRDNVTRPLWSDAELYRYLDEAQRRFCEATFGISDASMTVAVTEDQDYSDLDPSIIQIRSARWSDTNRPIERINFQDMEMDAFTEFNRSHRPKFMILGMEENKAFWAPVPDADYTVKLIVFRGPQNVIDDQATDFEIEFEHHECLLYYAKYMAFSKSDAERYDVGKAKDFESRFYTYCELVANKTQGRNRHTPRQVQYGGL